MARNLGAIVRDVYVFVGSFTYVTDFVVLEDRGEFIVIDMEEVMMGKSFRNVTQIEYDCVKGIPPIHVLSKMDLMNGFKYSHEKNKLMYKNCLNLVLEDRGEFIVIDMEEVMMGKSFRNVTQIEYDCVKGIPPIHVLRKMDLMNGFKYSHEKNKLMYKNCLNLGPEYQVDENMKEWLIHLDDDPDGGEDLKELEEYGNAGKLCHKKVINSIDGNNLAFLLLEDRGEFIVIDMEEVMMGKSFRNVTQIEYDCVKGMLYADALIVTGFNVSRS
nr:hypothetical protein [Tanacetum cinerariifolium]